MCSLWPMSVWPHSSFFIFSCDMKRPLLRTLHFYIKVTPSDAEPPWSRNRLIYKDTPAEAVQWLIRLATSNICHHGVCGILPGKKKNPSLFYRLVLKFHFYREPDSPSPQYNNILKDTKQQQQRQQKTLVKLLHSVNARVEATFWSGLSDKSLV